MARKALEGKRAQREAVERRNAPKRTNFNDVLMLVVSKGQLVPGLLALGFLVAVFKMPAENVPELANRILDKLTFEITSLAGWALLLLSVPGWFFHVRWIRRINARELKRTTDERNHFQQCLLGDDINTSVLDDSPREGAD